MHKPDPTCIPLESNNSTCTFYTTRNYQNNDNIFFLSSFNLTSLLKGSFNPSFSHGNNNEIVLLPDFFYSTKYVPKWFQSRTYDEWYNSRLTKKTRRKEINKNEEMKRRRWVGTVVVAVTTVTVVVVALGRNPNSVKLLCTCLRLETLDIRF